MEEEGFIEQGIIESVKKEELSMDYQKDEEDEEGEEDEEEKDEEDEEEKDKQECTSTTTTIDKGNKITINIVDYDISSSDIQQMFEQEEKRFEEEKIITNFARNLDRSFIANDKKVVVTILKEMELKEIKDNVDTMSAAFVLIKLMSSNEFCFLPPDINYIKYEVSQLALELTIKACNFHDKQRTTFPKAFADAVPKMLNKTKETLNAMEHPVSSLAFTISYLKNTFECFISGRLNDRIIQKGELFKAISAAGKLFTGDVESFSPMAKDKFRKIQEKVDQNHDDGWIDNIKRCYKLTYLILHAETLEVQKNAFSFLKSIYQEGELPPVDDEKPNKFQLVRRSTVTDVKKLIMHGGWQLQHAVLECLTKVVTDCQDNDLRSNACEMLVKRLSYLEIPKIEKNDVIGRIDKYTRENLVNSDSWHIVTMAVESLIYLQFHFQKSTTEIENKMKDLIENSLKEKKSELEKMVSEVGTNFIEKSLEKNLFHKLRRMQVIFSDVGKQNIIKLYLFQRAIMSKKNSKVIRIERELGKEILENPHLVFEFFVNKQSEESRKLLERQQSVSCLFNTPRRTISKNVLDIPEIETVSTPRNEEKQPVLDDSEEKQLVLDNDSEEKQHVPDNDSEKESIVQEESGAESTGNDNSDCCLIA